MNSNKPYNRVDRINRQILDILSDILIKNIDLSYLGFVTFTNVDVAPDLRTAKVFYSVFSGKLPDSKVDVEINKNFLEVIQPRSRYLTCSPNIALSTGEKIKTIRHVDQKIFKKNKIF